LHTENDFLQNFILVNELDTTIIVHSDYLPELAILLDLPSNVNYWCLSKFLLQLLGVPKCFRRPIFASDPYEQKYFRHSFNSDQEIQARLKFLVDNLCSSSFPFFRFKCEDLIEILELITLLKHKRQILEKLKVTKGLNSKLFSLVQNEVTYTSMVSVADDFLPDKDDLDTGTEVYAATKVVSFTFRKDVCKLNTIVTMNFSGEFILEKFSFNYYLQGAKDAKTRLAIIDDGRQLDDLWLDWISQPSLTPITTALKKAGIDFEEFLLACIDLEGDFIHKIAEDPEDDMEPRGYFIQPHIIKARAQQTNQLENKYSSDK